MNRRELLALAWALGLAPSLARAAVQEKMDGDATAARVSAPLPAILLFAAALAVVWRVKGAWVTPAIVAAAALAGWLVPL